MMMVYKMVKEHSLTLKEHSLTLMEISMKGNGRIGYIMVKEHMLGLKEIGMKAVSYTHLTLPTIYSV